MGETWLSVTCRWRVGCDGCSGGTHEGAGGTHGGAGGTHEGAGGTHGGTGDAHGGAGGAHESAGGTHEGAGGARESAGGARESAGGAREGAGGARESAGGTHEGAGGVREGAGGTYRYWGGRHLRTDLHPGAAEQCQAGFWRAQGRGKQVDDHSWLVTFMHYDRGYFDDEADRLEPIEHPFGPNLLPMSPERTLTGPEPFRAFVDVSDSQ